MQQHKNIQDKLITWIKNKVKAEYANDVCLVILYGSYVNGTSNRRSDVDCYFIPATKRAYEFGITFMIDGIGYDLFPVTWERAKGIANLKESLNPLIGDAKILYCRSEADAERFRGLQQQLKNNLLDDELSRNAALGRCNFAGSLRFALKPEANLSTIRKYAAHMIMHLADAVALYNHDYFHFGLKKQLDDLENGFPAVPSTIIENYKNVIAAETAEDVTRCALQMYDDVCAYLDAEPTPDAYPSDPCVPPEKPNTAFLSELYEEISSTFNKIYICCETGNSTLAFLSAACLQRELDDAAEAGCPSFDLLSTFHKEDLTDLDRRTHDIQQALTQFIHDNGGTVKHYDTFEQFESARL